MIVKELRNYLTDNNIGKEAIEKVEIEIKYGGYLNKEKSVEKFKKFENMKLDVNFDYSKHSISTEGRETDLIKPTTLGQASRISGVSPSDINILLVYLGR